MRSRTILIISLVSIVCGICYLSLTPTETITIGNDKISHFIAYAVLTINIGLLTFENKKQLVLGVIGAVLFGVIIEILQYYVPGRFMSLFDVIANTVGVLIGTIITLLFARKVNNFLTRINLR